MQKATAISGDPNRHISAASVNPIELGPSNNLAAPGRTLTSSNSFDSKSNLSTNFQPTFQMSAEASKLFHTLQQSPLPPSSQEVITLQVISNIFENKS